MTTREIGIAHGGKVAKWFREFMKYDMKLPERRILEYEEFEMEDGMTMFLVKVDIDNGEASPEWDIPFKFGLFVSHVYGHGADINDKKTLGLPFKGN